MFERLDVVRRRKSTGTEKLEEVEQPVLPRPFGLLPGGESPGADIHEIGGCGIIGPHRHRHDVVDHQIGEDEQVAIEGSDAVGALLPEPLEQAVIEARKLALAFLAPGRNPLRNGATPGGLVLEHGMPFAEIAGRSLERDLSERARRRLQIVQIGRMRRQCVIAVDAVFGQKLPVGAH